MVAQSGPAGPRQPRFLNDWESGVGQCGGGGAPSSQARGGSASGAACWRDPRRVGCAAAARSSGAPVAAHAPHSRACGARSVVQRRPVRAHRRHSRNPQRQQQRRKRRVSACGRPAPHARSRGRQPKWPRAPPLLARGERCAWSAAGARPSGRARAQEDARRVTLEPGAVTQTSGLIRAPNMQNVQSRAVRRRRIWQRSSARQLQQAVPCAMARPAGVHPAAAP